MAYTPSCPTNETTQAPASGLVGGVFKDNATISRLLATSTLFPYTTLFRSNKECKNTPLAEDSIAVTANATYETPKGATLSSVGTYYWVASYSGDQDRTTTQLNSSH